MQQRTGDETTVVKTDADKDNPEDADRKKAGRADAAKAGTAKAGRTGSKAGAAPKAADKPDYGPEPKPIKGDGLAKVLDLAVEAYGEFEPMEAADGLGEVLDHAVYVLIARNVPRRRAEEAVRRLHTEFVDWNEVRLAEAFELAELWTDLIQVPDLFQRCEKVKSLIAQVYQDQNKISLDMLKEREPEERVQYLEAVQALAPDQRQYLALVLAGMDQVVFHWSLARVVQRLEVVKRTGSPAQMQSLLEGVLTRRTKAVDQMALVWLGEAICQSKNPLCRQCPLVRVCVSRKV